VLEIIKNVPSCNINKNSGNYNWGLALQALPIERCPQFRDQPPGSTATYNGKCYIFYNRQPLNFKESLAFCRSRGGTLVDESNPALQGFISWELWRRHRLVLSSGVCIYFYHLLNGKLMFKWEHSNNYVNTDISHAFLSSSGIYQDRFWPVKV